MGTPAIDYQNALLGILMHRLFSIKLSATDYYDLRITLDEQISRLGPSVARYLEGLVFGTFDVVETVPIPGSLALVDWYIETMAGKPVEWFTELNAERTLRVYSLVAESTRMRLLRFALSIEYLQQIDIESSAIVFRVRENELLAETNRMLTAEGEVVCRALIDEYLMDSPERTRHTQRAIGGFAIQVLRQCLLDADQPLQEWLEALLLKRFGSIGERRLENVRFALQRRLT